MKLYLTGHDYRYALEQSMMTLFPGERPEYPDAPPAPEESAAWSALTINDETATATAKLQRCGKTAEAAFTCPSAQLTGGLVTDRLLQRILKQAFYQASLPLRDGPPPPWGALTGVKPGKLMARYLTEGKTAARL